MDSVKHGLEAVGWRNVEMSVMEPYWGWTSTEEVDRYIFEAQNPIVGSLMKGMTQARIGKLRESFNHVITEEYDNGRGIHETAILAVATK